MTTAAGGVTTVATSAAPAGAGLPANATLDQLVASVQPMFGSTTDVMGEFAIFGITPPAGVPTAAGSQVEEFEIRFVDLEKDDPYYRGVVVFTSTQPAADMVSLYQSGLVAAGFTQTGDSVDVLGTDQFRRLEYQIPGATHGFSEFTVQVVDGDVDTVTIEWRDGLDATTAAGAAAAFRAWTGLPLVDQADPIEEGTIGNYIVGEQLNIGTSYHLAVPPAQLESQFLAALAGTPFTVDPEFTRPGEWSQLVGGPFDELTVFFGNSYLADTMSELGVEAYVDL